jgi:hypothetical protein
VINQIRAFLLERGIPIRQGWRALRAELPRALAMTDKLTPRMVHFVEDLAGDRRHLDAHRFRRRLRSSRTLTKLGSG